MGRRTLLDDLQLRGMHRHYLGDTVTVSTRNGLVNVMTFRRETGHVAGTTMTPDQADELARDLQAYAEAARRGA